MKYSIPAKTFFLGEYAALSGGSALIMTTRPCFELVIQEPSLNGYSFHPDSPAGRWWQEPSTLAWHDPYQGIGGLGASSAQFIGVYLASMQEKPVSLSDVFNAYQQVAFGGKGLRPSGYDVLAQCLQGIVYINRQQSVYQSYPWPFDDLAFLLVHTGHKLATHHHLESMAQPGHDSDLSNLVDSARVAFERVDSGRVIDAVNGYHQALATRQLVAEHSLQLINRLKSKLNPLAIKGCGAMGSDVLLLVVLNNQLSACIKAVKDAGLVTLATNQDLNQQPLIKLKNSERLIAL